MRSAAAGWVAGFVALFVGLAGDARAAEPEFTLSALPTTLRMPARGFAFRLTHRFSRPIASGSAGDFFADFFGMDGAAKIGLELRYGLAPGTQIAVHRTNDRTIQLVAQHQFLRLGAGELGRLKAELTTDARRWLDRVAPRLIETFEQAVSGDDHDDARPERAS